MHIAPDAHSTCVYIYTCVAEVEGDKDKLARDAQHKLWKQMLTAAYSAYKTVASFRPFYNSKTAFGGKKDASGKLGNVTPRPASTIWEAVQHRASFKGLVAPLTGSTARKVFGEYLAQAGACPPLTDSALVRTESVEAMDLGGLSAVCDIYRSRLSVPFNAPELLATEKTEAGPFPIRIDANDLTTCAGLERINDTIAIALADLASASWKEVLALLAAVPDGAFFALVNVLDNKVGTEPAYDPITGALISATPPAPTLFGSGLSSDEVTSAAACDMDPASGAAAAAGGDEFNPPVLTFSLMYRGAIPPFLTSPAAALTALQAQEAALDGGYGGAYGGARPPRSAAGGGEAIGDPWTDAKRTMAQMRKRAEAQVGFGDLARAMKADVESMFAALDCMEDPTLE